MQVHVDYRFSLLIARRFSIALQYSVNGDGGKPCRLVSQPKDVGQALRDYRNYIHPEKELSHGITLVAEDTAMFLNVFTSVAEQIIKSV